ncbi:hypothetical protein [Rhizobium sp. AN5]|uniref:hypothetical protein n=1 Tax=Rhizobium sp. AN5 TaxID=1855304 RepID=UPI00117A7BEA|nr:hypothetical protein [Rhizobium sp. AN5]
MSQVNQELGKAWNAPIYLNDGNVRNLAGRSSGWISMGDLHGKSSVVQEGPAYDSNYGWTRVNHAFLGTYAQLVWGGGEVARIDYNATSWSGGGWTYYRGDYRQDMSDDNGEISGFAIYRRNG